TVDPTLVVKEKPVKHSMFFDDSSSAGGADPNNGVFLDLTDSDFLVSGMEHDQLFTEFNIRAARQMSLSAEVRMRAEYNVKERRSLKFVVEKQDEILKIREGEIENLKARLLLREAEAEASNFEAIEKSLRDETDALRERNVILKKERNALDVKVMELEASAVNKGCKLTDLKAQLTSVKSQNDNLVDR
ncbi:hypothetical protein Tco_0220837, partial [Tanacetum coccineum]